MAGTFISFEGIDGCGKSTQVKYIVSALKELGANCVCLREPGGTAISEKIRGLLLDPQNMEMRPEAELLLYEASRAQLVRQVIEPALAAGSIVLCDRYFDSTFAYQAAARGLDEDVVRTANELGSCGFVPDATIVFDLDVETALTRATRGGADRLEAEGVAFQRRVRDGYLRSAELESERIRLVDADGTPEQVFGRLVEALVPVLPVLASLDVKAFLSRQADLERAMADIALSLGEDA
ncbi:MAG: dTMP kinase [Atopobiaceae bacterium]|nr:dTMP kinase [Atopobiaceae bacterium]MBR1828703.1 dTMP kinase [Atopobiaceae bacterium]